MSRIALARATATSAAALARTTLAIAAIAAGLSPWFVSAEARASVTDQGISKPLDEVHRVYPTVDAATAADKDLWDKASAIGPLIGGVLVATIGAFATVAYNTRQQRAAERQAAQQLIVNRVQTLAEFLPHLASSDPRQVEAALVSIAQLGDPELATSMAVIYKGEGGLGALGRLASGPDAAIAKTAQATLASTFADIRDSVAQIWRDNKPMGVGVFVDTHKLATMNYVVQNPGHQVQAEYVTARVGDAERPLTLVHGSSDELGSVAILSSELSGKPVRIGSTDKLAIGETVTVVGFTQLPMMEREDVDIQIVSARVDGLIAGDIKIGDVDMGPLFGGAPVLDTSGAMIGMIRARSTPGSRAGGLATPIEDVISALGGPSSE